MIYKDIKTIYRVSHSISFHEYFDEIGLRFNILDKAIYTENKLKSLEEVESIKTYLGNIIESVKFDVNYIF
ncbi:hypothetical protein QKA_2128 [Clostridioides difficile DA00165]|nr:hypothetical protein QKA_2128 [Clostridioides difficile DA00165]